MTSIAQPRVVARLIARLDEVRPNTPRRWGTMTAGEMLCHLGDAAEAVLARAGTPGGPSRPLRRWLGLYAPIRWPHGLKTRREIDPRADGTKPGDFEADRQRAIKGLQALAAAPPGAWPAAHSILGNLTPPDWQRWAYRHTDHHLRQFGV
jgi:hypothetical protein